MRAGLTARRNTLLRVGLHAAALAPLAWLAFDVATQRLSSNPIQDLTFRTGKPALICLVLNLACSPLNSAFGWRWLLPHRRTLGLYAFLYASLHFMVFVGVDYFFFLDARNQFSMALLRDAVLEKRYAVIGFSAFLILLALASTSTKGWQRRLGKRWKQLHQLVYVAGVLAVIHYVWLVKSDYRQPLLFGAIVAVLLAARTARGRAALARFKASRTATRISEPRQRPSVP